MIETHEANNRYDEKFHLEEILTIMMLLLLDTLILLSERRGQMISIFFLNIGLASFVAAVRYVPPRRKFLMVFRDFHVLIVLVIIYLEHHTLIPLINPHDVDALLIKADRMLFNGHDPTILLERMMHPVLTELLQIVYASFYFLPFTLCVILYRSSKMDFHIAASTILLGFYISYIGYYLAPALGPRYTIAHLHNEPLQGIFAFQFLRDSIDAMEGVTRDCFPSGHTLISILTVFLARKFHRPFMNKALIWTVFMLAAAVYLRYHYVTDIMAGAVLSVAVYSLAPAASRFIKAADESTITAC